MLNLHIFFVIVATIILIIFAESQKLRKITWILIVGCIGYLILIITPECSNPSNNDVHVKTYTKPIVTDIQKIIPSEDNLEEPKIEIVDEQTEIATEEINDDMEDRFIQNLKINSLIITTEIVDKTPVDSARLFLNDIEHLYCYTSIYNPFNNNKIVHNWQFEGTNYFNNIIDIGRSDSWRCWSRISVKPELAGNWKVTVSDTSGNDLDSIEFTLLPTE